MRKWTVWIALLLAFCMLLAGCAAQTQEAVESPESATEAAVQPAGQGEEATPEELDVFGNAPVNLTNVERIVSLTPAGTEIVCALGGGELLVGVDASSNYPESVQDVEIVGDYNGPDVEKIVSLEPDVVLAGNTLQQDVIDNLKAMGLEVVSVEATTFMEIPYAFELIGNILNAGPAAEELVSALNDAVAQAQETQPEEAKTVYYAMSYGDAGNWTSGPDSFIYTMIELTGGVPVPDDPSLPMWVEYPVEDLVAANPDIILVDSSMGAFGDIAGQNGYKDLDAVKNGRTYEIDADIFTRPGPRIIDALNELSRILNEQ